MPGGTCSFLVRDTFGRRWVLKPLNNPQGPLVATNELVASILLRQVGLPCPDWKTLNVGIDFARRHRRISPTRELLDLSRPHFASRYAGDEMKVFAPLFPVVPDHFEWINTLVGLYVFDLWAAQQDKRQVLVGVRNWPGTDRLLAIDHGHLFFGPGARQDRESTMLPWTFSQPLIQIACRKESKPLIESWIWLLQKKLPTAIQDLHRHIPFGWEPNRLMKEPGSFLQRLWKLPERVHDHLAAYRSSIVH